MTQKDGPPYPVLDLGGVLKGIGHTPESFARVIGRNASGLRRAIRGETTMHHSTAREIAVRLAQEGWTGDPNEIMQLREAVPGLIERPRVPGPPSTVAKPVPRGRREPPPGYRVQLALGELMRALGRREVDRVYVRVFGVSPGSPYEKDN